MTYENLETYEENKYFYLALVKKHYEVSIWNPAKMPSFIDGIPVVCVNIYDSKVYVDMDMTLEEAEEKKINKKLINEKYIIKNINFTGDKLIIPSKINGINVELDKNAGAKVDANELIIEEGIKEIPHSCFSNSKIKTVKLPESIKTIRVSAFCDSTLENINLENVENIEFDAFARSRIKEINLKNLKIISSNAFCSCVDLKKVNLSDKLTILPVGVFEKTSIKTIDLKNVENLKDLAFSECSNLEKVYGDNLKEINYKAFSDCENLSLINLSKVNYVKEQAFMNCKKLKNITFDENTSIWNNAFGFANIDNLTFNQGCDCGMFTFVNTTVNNLTFNGPTYILEESFATCIINNLILNHNITMFGISNTKINNIEINDDFNYRKSFLSERYFNNITINNYTQNKYPELNSNDITDYKTLLDMGFSNVQTSQILKAQDDNILISSISPHTPSNIIHSLIDLKRKDVVLANKILKMCNKKLTLEQEIEINKMITDYNEKNNKKNINVDLEK